MEEVRSPEGYKITQARIPILLTLRHVSELKAHEQTVSNDLKQLTLALRSKPVLRHPLIVDEKTGLVLDGNHRLGALHRAKCNFAPCALVKYEDPQIRVERWFRTLEGLNLDQFRKQLAPSTARKCPSEDGERFLQERTCYAAVEDDQSCIVFPSHDRDPLRLARKAFAMETKARISEVKIAYSDSKIHGNDKSSLVMSTITVKKAEVVETCGRHEVFPPKTTRHIIPSRPLGIDVPVELLRQSDLQMAQREFIGHLGSKKLERLPEGSWVGSRRYQEEVLVFE